MVALQFGGMIYTSFLTAPIIFMVLDKPDARSFTSVLWPRYFTLNAVLGLLTGICFVLLQMFTGESGLSLYVLLALLSALFMGVNRGAINPINRSRNESDSSDGQDESGDSQNSTFSWLHRMTVGLNYVCIFLNGWLLFGIAGNI
ncbi:MAG: DUF4149 domain-containing protein [bacterium]